MEFQLKYSLVSISIIGCICNYSINAMENQTSIGKHDMKKESQNAYLEICRAHNPEDKVCYRISSQLFDHFDVNWKCNYVKDIKNINDLLYVQLYGDNEIFVNSNITELNQNQVNSIKLLADAASAANKNVIDDIILRRNCSNYYRDKFVLLTTVHDKLIYDNQYHYYNNEIKLLKNFIKILENECYNKSNLRIQDYNNLLKYFLYICVNMLIDDAKDKCRSDNNISNVVQQFLGFTYSGYKSDSINKHDEDNKEDISKYIIRKLIANIDKNNDSEEVIDENNDSKKVLDIVNAIIEYIEKLLFEKYFCDTTDTQKQIIKNKYLNQYNIILRFFNMDALIKLCHDPIINVPQDVPSL